MEPMELADIIARMRRLECSLIPEAREDTARYLAIASGLTPARGAERGKSTGGRDNAVEARSADYAAAKAQEDRYVREYKCLRACLSRAINQIPEDVPRRIAKRHYLDGQRLTQIAEDLHYSTSTIYNYIAIARKYMIASLCKT